MKLIINKSISLLLSLLLLTMLFAGCGLNNEPNDSLDSQNLQELQNATENNDSNLSVRIAGLKGPTSMGLVKLMEENEANTSNNSYEFTIAGSADEITPKLIRGEFDIAAVPANLASVLYNNTNGEIQLLAINTLGVIYIVEKGTDITSLEQLKGQTIYATGKGSTPEYALRYILSQNGIDPDKDVTLEFKSEPTEVVALLKTSESGVAMLPQPYVTVAGNNVEGLKVAIDLTEEWDKLDNGSKLLTGTLVVRKAFAQEHPEIIANFLVEYQASTEYINDNVKEASLLVEKYGIVNASIAEKAIPYCNITFLAGSDMKTPMNGYLQTLFDQKPAAIGGALPDDNFYYQK